MSFWKDKKVLITGHTGFKGSWLSLYLKLMGAHVFGYALEPERLSIFNVASVGSEIEGIFADIRNLSHLEDFVQQVQPELLFHLAAQPLVHKSYLNPIETVETNPELKENTAVQLLWKDYNPEQHKERSTFKKELATWQ